MNNVSVMMNTDHTTEGGGMCVLLQHGLFVTLLSHHPNCSHKISLDSLTQSLKSFYFFIKKKKKHLGL